MLLVLLDKVRHRESCAGLVGAEGQQEATVVIIKGSDEQSGQALSGQYSSIHHPLCCMQTSAPHFTYV